MLDTLVLVAASLITTLSAEDLGTDTVTLRGCWGASWFSRPIVCWISASFLTVRTISYPDCKLYFWLVQSWPTDSRLCLVENFENL